jgi:hypothetical protein
MQKINRKQDLYNRIRLDEYTGTHIKSLMVFKDKELLLFKSNRPDEAYIEKAHRKCSS